MNTALKLSQERFDAQLPLPVSESSQEETRAEWIFNAVEQLVRFGSDVSFQRRMREPQGVTVTDLALAVDEHANGRLEDCKVHTAALGWLISNHLSLVESNRPHANALSDQVAQFLAAGGQIKQLPGPPRNSAPQSAQPA